MPVIRRSDIKSEEAQPGRQRLTLVNAALGAGHLDMGELAIAPGVHGPLHMHPAHEEAIYILEGPVSFVLGDESGTVDTGDVILAPAGVKHQIINSDSEPRRIMFIFPTTNVQRVLL